jgi:hypothetical protein
VIIKIVFERTLPCGNGNLRAGGWKGDHLQAEDEQGRTLKRRLTGQWFAAMGVYETVRVSMSAHPLLR